MKSKTTRRKLASVQPAPVQRAPISRKTPRAHYPKGWDCRRADAIATYYDNQSDDQAIAQAEAAYRKRNVALMEVPLKLVPAVRRLLARKAG